jgi:carboxymethylenebutenolidase
MSPLYIDSLLVQTEDMTLGSGDITYESPKGKGTIKGLLSQPRDTITKLPGVSVVHENRA